MNEKKLLTSLKKGDHKAFTILYNQYWRQVYNFCRLYAAADVAEEVMQEVFIKLWTVRAFIKEEENFKGYLFIITRNIIFDQYRKNVNETSLKVALMAAVDDSYEFEEEISANDLREYIDGLLKEMPTQRQLIFNLSRKENLTYKEIAERLNMTEKAVEQSIGRTIKFLKQNLIHLLAIILLNQ